MVQVLPSGGYEYKLIPLDEILGTADDIASVHFVDVDVVYTDPIESEAGCFPLCPEFKEVDKGVFTDFVKIKYAAYS